MSHFLWEFFILPSCLVQFNDPVAGIADIVLGSPAASTCPPATDTALAEFAYGKRGVTEVAGIPGKTSGYLCRKLPLLTHLAYLLLQLEVKVRTLPRFRIYRPGQVLFPQRQAFPPVVQGSRKFLFRIHRDQIPSLRSFPAAVHVLP